MLISLVWGGLNPHFQSLNRVLYTKLLWQVMQRRRSMWNLSRPLWNWATVQPRRQASFQKEKKKAYAFVGSLGCSKCKENTSAGLPLFYLFATSCSNMFDFRRDSYCTSVCWDLFVLDFSCFLLGYSSLAPLMVWLWIPLSEEGLFGD